MNLGMYVWDRSDNFITEEQDPSVWSNWFETSDRKLCRDVIGESTISTVFLGLDHSFTDGATPVLWETMVFGGPLDGEMDSYETQQEAEDGHQVMIEKVKKAQAQ